MKRSSSMAILTSPLTPDSVRQDYLHPSDAQTVCSWKGTASYYILDVDGKHNPDAAW